jgi:hypothetical protein
MVLKIQSYMIFLSSFTYRNIVNGSVWKIFFYYRWYFKQNLPYLSATNGKLKQKQTAIGECLYRNSICQMRPIYLKFTVKSLLAWCCRGAGNLVTSSHWLVSGLYAMTSSHTGSVSSLGAPPTVTKHTTAFFRGTVLAD